MAEHIGIDLVIDTPWGQLLRMNSDRLYWTALAHGDICVSYNPLLHGPDHGWHEVFPGDGQAFNGSRDIVIRVRPVMLDGADDLDTDSGYPYATQPPTRQTLLPRIRGRWRGRNGRSSRQRDNARG
jgi:hypothetical protein